jgi:uncharacterized protein (DUF849 family)
MTLIAVAPNGARKTKEDHSAIPLSIDEIAADAKACKEAGAGMIHLHVRDELGHHSLSVDLYQRAISAIQSLVGNDLFIQVTTESVEKYTPDEQFGMIHVLKPASVSIAIREIKKLDDLDIFENFKLMRENNILPQIILYNHHDLSVYKKWLDEGILPGNAYPVLLVIGKSHAKGSFELDDLPDDGDFPATSTMVCAFGNEEFASGKLAIERGWHVRLGFENNQVLENGETAENNAALIAEMANYIQSKNGKAETAKAAQILMTPDW